LTFLLYFKNDLTCIVEHNPESNITLIEHEKDENPNVSPIILSGKRGGGRDRKIVRRDREIER
jgi:hypothetical protein